MPAKIIHQAWTDDAGATYFITVDGKWDVICKVITDRDGNRAFPAQSRG
jgi:hypothetical protein